MAAYRMNVAKWSRSYSNACFNYKRTGRIADPGALQWDIDTTNTVCRPGHSPREEQVQPILLGINFGRMALFGDMGFGKTFTSGYIIAHAQRIGHLRNQLKRTAVVFCPKNVIPEWHKQAPEFFGLRVASFPGDNIEHADVIVTNYEQAANLYEVAKNRIGFVALDESHRVKNYYTQTFSNMAAMCEDVWFRLVLSGTPQTNDPKDLFTQLSLINPYAFGFSHGYMMNRFYRTIRTGAFERQEFRKSDAPVFKNAVSRNSIVYTVDNSHIDQTKQVVKCALTAEQETMLDKLREGNITASKVTQRKVAGVYAKGNTVDVRALILRELQVSSGFLPMQGSECLRFKSDKIDKAVDVISREWAGEKIVVWVQFRETAQRLQQLIGSRSAVLYGGMSTQARKQVVAEFESGSTQVVIAQIRAGNAGVNWQFCQHMLFVELDWASATIDQAVARIIRSGQKGKCAIRFLYTAGTADELMIHAYTNKRKLSASVLNDYVTKGSIDARGVSFARKSRKSKLEKAIETPWGKIPPVYA